MNTDINAEHGANFDLSHDRMLVWTLEARERLPELILGPHPGWTNGEIAACRLDARNAIDTVTRILESRLRDLERKLMDRASAARKSRSAQGPEDIARELDKVRAAFEAYREWPGLNEPPEAKYETDALAQVPVFDDKRSIVGFVDVLISATSFKLGLELPDFHRIPDLLEASRPFPRWRLSLGSTYRFAFILMPYSLTLCETIRQVRGLAAYAPDVAFFVVSRCEMFDGTDWNFVNVLNQQGIGHIHYPSMAVHKPIG